MEQNNQSTYLKNLEKEQIKFKTNTRKEIKIRMEIKKIKK